MLKQTQLVNVAIDKMASKSLLKVGSGEPLLIDTRYPQTRFGDEEPH